MVSKRDLRRSFRCDSPSEARNATSVAGGSEGQEDVVKARTSGRGGAEDEEEGEPGVGMMTRRKGVGL